MIVFWFGTVEEYKDANGNLIREEWYKNENGDYFYLEETDVIYNKQDYPNGKCFFEYFWDEKFNHVTRRPLLHSDAKKLSLISPEEKAKIEREKIDFIEKGLEQLAQIPSPKKACSLA